MVDIDYDEVCKHLGGILKIAKTIGMSDNDALSTAYAGVKNITSVNLEELLSSTNMDTPKEELVAQEDYVTTFDISVKLGYRKPSKISKFLVYNGYLIPHTERKEYYYTVTEKGKPYCLNYSGAPQKKVLWRPSILDIFPEHIPVYPPMNTYNFTMEETDGKKISND